MRLYYFESHWKPAEVKKVFKKKSFGQSKMKPNGKDSF